MLTAVSDDGVDLGGHVLRVAPVSRLVIRQRSLGHVRQPNSLPNRHNTNTEHTSAFINSWRLSKGVYYNQGHT